MKSHLVRFGRLMGEESLKRDNQHVAFGQVKFDMPDQSFAYLLSYSFIPHLPMPSSVYQGTFPSLFSLWFLDTFGQWESREEYWRARGKTSGFLHSSLCALWVGWGVSPATAVVHLVL